MRNPQKAEALGVEARTFDYSKPETQVDALKGINRLLLISGSEVGKRTEQHRNVINAAKVAGVEWIVYTSVLRADSSTLSLAAEHVETEKMLQESDIPFSLLRNGWYSENYTVSIGGALQNGAFIGSAGDGKISSAARADYGEAAANVLADESNKGKTFELGGDSAYTLSEFAAEISNQLGNDIPYKDLPESVFADILKEAGLPEGFAQMLANSDISASKGDLFEDGKQLSQLLGRPTTPIANSIKEALKQIG
ncbi:NAD(P)H dehydrogenase (quinone) [Sediminitomix flava]|uniref:NAD(P)H dehydrogenase (Quinone) n=1 Tax=Sediminitomix flava TaxID=379075 RepID=A0A315ZCF5_SEDFL|nr:NAD(P)H dehydrogenase (quinone) [Sediminitomix flava]